MALEALHFSSAGTTLLYTSRTETLAGTTSKAAAAQNRSPTVETVMTLSWKLCRLWSHLVIPPQECTFVRTMESIEELTRTDDCQVLSLPKRETATAWACCRSCCGFKQGDEPMSCHFRQVPFRRARFHTEGGLLSLDSSVPRYTESEKGC